MGPGDTRSRVCPRRDIHAQGHCVRLSTPALRRCIPDKLRRRTIKRSAREISTIEPPLPVKRVDIRRIASREHKMATQIDGQHSSMVAVDASASASGRSDAGVVYHHCQRAEFVDMRIDRSIRLDSVLAWTATALPPSARILATTSCARCSLLAYVSTTSKPLRAAATAMASPMPRLPPVTRNTFASTAYCHISWCRRDV